MPGAYAHITVVNHAQKMMRKTTISRTTKYALGMHLKYAELGAVSPDYPYLSAGQGLWADNMHYLNTSTLMKAGINRLNLLVGLDREKATSWLFGFVAHMVTDMTIHPVVERIVGPYKGNEAAHRQCEMHQDAFIFQKMDLGDVGLTDHLKTGIASCSLPADGDKLDPVISALWLAMLKEAYPGDEQKTAPMPNQWHQGFTGLLKALTTTNRLFPFSRHVATRLNLTYPEQSKVDMKYILNLNTPSGPMSYEAVFDQACKNVLAVWEGLDQALSGISQSYLYTLANWDLDTGRRVPQNSYIFWKDMA
jgi:hypothetical protein